MTPDHIRQVEKQERRKRFDLRRAWNQQLSGGGKSRKVDRKALIRAKRVAHFNRKYATRNSAWKVPSSKPSWVRKLPLYRKPFKYRKPSKYTTLVPGEKWEVVTWENADTPFEKKITTYQQYEWSNYNQGVVSKSRGDGDCGYHSIAKGLKLARGIDVTGPTLRSMIAENPLWNRVVGRHKDTAVRGRVPWM